MTPFTVYDDDGRILRYGQCPDDHVTRQARGGEFVTPFASNDMTDYVFQGVVRARPAMTTSIPTTAVADGVTAVTLSDVPAGATVTVQGPSDISGVTEDYGDVSLTFALPGTYTVRIECFPYVTLEGTLHAA